MKLYLNIPNIQALAHRLKIACDRKAVKPVVRQHPFPVVQGQVYRGKRNYQNLSAAALPLSCPMPRLTQGSSEDDSQICGVKVLSPKEENSRSPVLSPDSAPQLNRCPRGRGSGTCVGTSAFATRDNVMPETLRISAAQPRQARQKPT